MAKSLPNVSTLYDALEYAHAAVKDAFTVCPKSASKYQDVVTLAGKGASVSQLKSALDSANDECHYEKYGSYSTSPSGSKPPPSGGTAPSGTGVPGGSGTSLTTQKAGFPLWLVLLLGGGALVYYMMSKDKKTGQTRAKRTYYKARRKVRKVVKKVRKARAARRRR